MPFLMGFGLFVVTGLASAYRPWLGVFLISCLLPLDLPLEIGITVYTNELLITATLLGWGIKLLCTRTWPVFSWQELLFGVPFLLAILISAINAESALMVAKQFMRWLQFVLLVWYAANTLSNEKQISAVVYALLAAAILAATFGVVQSLAGPQSALNYSQTVMPLYQDKIIRAYSTFGHPNQFAGYLLCFLPLLGVSFFLEKRREIKIALGTGLLVCGLAFILTYTRGAWISALAAGMLWLYLRGAKKALFVILGCLAAVFILFFIYVSHTTSKAPPVVQRIVSIAKPGQEDSVNFRTVCTKTALHMFARHPWVGFGAGEYELNIRKYFDENYYAWMAVNKHVHNLYLQILIEAGLLGLLGFFILLGYLGLRLIKALNSVQSLASSFGKRYPPPSFFLSEGGGAATPRASAGIPLYIEAVLIGGSAYLLANFFDVLTIYARGIHFSLLIGLGLAYIKMKTADVVPILNSEVRI